MNKFIKTIKNNLLLTAAVLATIVIWIFNPNKGMNILKNFLNTCESTIPILILMFALLAFIKVGMNSDAVQKGIQKNTGIKSIMFGYIFGLLVSGPIYPGFSLGKILMEHGIKIRVVIIMLSTWATLKVALLPFEIKILGLHVTIVRWIVTGIVIFLIAILCEVIIKYVENKKNKLMEKEIIEEIDM